MPTNRNQSISSSCVYILNFSLAIIKSRIHSGCGKRRSSQRLWLPPLQWTISNTWPTTYLGMPNMTEWTNRLWSLCSSVPKVAIGHLSKPNPLQACWSSCLPLRGFKSSSTQVSKTFEYDEGWSDLIVNKICDLFVKCNIQSWDVYCVLQFYLGSVQ